MSFADIRQILENHAHNDLIGRVEDEWLEAKGLNPYDLDSPPGRYELAKDVSAFANNSGGFIVIGVTTAVNQDQQTETITAITPFPQGAFQAHRYISIVEECIHPNIENFRAAWVPTNQEQNQGIAIIEVPPQNQERQYFLIANVVESGANIKQIVFGVAVRNDSSNEPFTRAQLYRYTLQGKSPTTQLLARMNEKLDALIVQSQQQPPEADPESQYAARAADILGEQEP
jgi:predicted HTH transcriptional regulator